MISESVRLDAIKNNTDNNKEKKKDQTREKLKRGKAKKH